MNWLQRQTVARPRSVAFRYGPRATTYAELGARVQRMAAALAVAGIDAGSRIAVLMSNSPTYVELVHAGMWLQATLVPLNVRLSDRDLSWQIQSIDADLLVFDYEQSRRQLDLETTRFVQIEDLTYSRTLEARSLDPSNVATILYTSGTSGPSRPVPLTWANHEASAVASAFNLGIGRDDDWLCCLPLYHVGGLAILYRSVLYGTSVTLTDGFDVAQVAELIGSGQVTLASFVPTMLRRLVFEHTTPLAELVRAGRLRGILLGGGPADRETLEYCAEHEIPVFQTYGMTEASSQIATVPPERALSKLGSAGVAVHGAELSIRDAEGRPTTGSGTIWIRGPMVTRGYHDSDSTSAEASFHRDWFCTGDLGELDEDGFLWIHTRRDDLIVSGGENIYPVQVEAVLDAHPAVTESAVFGLEDPDWGQMVAAAVVLDYPVSAGELKEYCRQRLGAFRTPKVWRFLDALPRTSTGKIMRSKLRDEADWKSCGE